MQFEYKDANRDWWRIILVPDEEDGPDRWWRYFLLKETQKVWSGRIFVIDGLQPTAEAAMMDFAAGAAILAVGFAHSEGLRVKHRICGGKPQ